ncbi:hypothetical protein BU16DRAFT_44901 [Lophium mytilinum]|uniref:Uncharacterized protein n=1 Tax=Lophium mytilinum TaxID=390894 RepID=A0A6A6QQI7_9PEZI|nr:hypothetical protein BU16DRAFT_44901 [Lophium mytilinum]
MVPSKSLIASFISVIFSSTIKADPACYDSDITCPKATIQAPWNDLCTGAVLRIDYTKIYPQNISISNVFSGNRCSDYGEGISGYVFGAFIQSIQTTCTPLNQCGAMNSSFPTGSNSQILNFVCTGAGCIDENVGGNVGIVASTSGSDVAPDNSAIVVSPGTSEVVAPIPTAEAVPVPSSSAIDTSSAVPSPPSSAVPSPRHHRRRGLHYSLDAQHADRLRWQDRGVGSRYSYLHASCCLVGVYEYAEGGGG